MPISGLNIFHRKESNFRNMEMLWRQPRSWICQNVYFARQPLIGCGPVTITGTSKQKRDDSVNKSLWQITGCCPSCSSKPSCRPPWWGQPPVVVCFYLPYSSLILFLPNSSRLQLPTSQGYAAFPCLTLCPLVCCSGAVVKTLAHINLVLRLT